MNRPPFSLGPRTAARAAVFAIALALAACGDGGGSVGVGGGVGIGIGVGVGAGIGVGGFGAGVGVGPGFIQPMVLEVRALRSDAIQLAWSGRRDANGYVLLRNGIELLRTTGFTAVDRPLVQGQNYCYRVLALVGDVSAFSTNEVCVVPPRPDQLEQPFIP